MAFYIVTSGFYVVLLHNTAPGVTGATLKECHEPAKVPQDYNDCATYFGGCSNTVLVDWKEPGTGA